MSADDPRMGAVKAADIRNKFDFPVFRGSPNGLGRLLINRERSAIADLTNVRLEAP